MKTVTLNDVKLALDELLEEKSNITNMDIKNKLRADGFYATQKIVSDIMNQLDTSDYLITYGQYKIYNTPTGMSFQADDEDNIIDGINDCLDCNCNSSCNNASMKAIADYIYTFKKFDTTCYLFDKAGILEDLCDEFDVVLETFDGCDECYYVAFNYTKKFHTPHDRVRYFGRYTTAKFSGKNYNYCSSTQKK